MESNFVNGSTDEHTVRFELTPNDFHDVKRIDKRPAWSMILAGAIILPSLVALYLGGFRFALGVVALVLVALILSGFKAAERLRFAKFSRHRCAPVEVRATPHFLEVDGFVEWRRIHWTHIEQVQSQFGWLVIRLLEGDPVLIPARAFEQDDQRAAFLQQIKSGIERSRSGSLEPLEDHLRWIDDAGDDEAAPSQANYVIDSQYMQGLVELRFADKVGWGRVVVIALLTASACWIWKSETQKIAAAGAAIAIPLWLLRVVETVMKGRAIRENQMDEPLPMTLVLHEEGYERRCRQFQAFTSWSLVRSIRVHDQYFIFSHLDDEHLLAPTSAWDDLDNAKRFRDEAESLRDAWTADGNEDEDAETDTAEP